MDFQQNPLLHIYIIDSFLLCGLLATYNQLINHAQKSRKLPLNVPKYIKLKEHLLQICIYISVFTVINNLVLLRQCDNNWIMNLDFVKNMVLIIESLNVTWGLKWEIKGWTGKNLWAKQN